MKPALPSARQQQVLRLGVCALLAAAAVSGTAYRLVLMNRCAMDHDLVELLLYGTEQLQAANVPYWLEFGTLLGAVRDKAVVPWEFDVDLAVTEQHCERVLELREKFAREKGYKMYGRGEFVPEKASLFGMVGGTISAPCVRVYSRDGTLPLDIYWSKVLTLTPDHTTAEGRRYIPPPDRSGDLISAARSAGSADSADIATAEQIVCDHEAFTTDFGDHSSPCRWYNDIFPLTTTAMYGRQFPVPRRSRKILTQTYGPNWMTPKPKGYKALLCPPVWHTGSGTVYGVATAGALALAAALFVYLRASYATALAAAGSAAATATATAAAVAAGKDKDAKAAAVSGSEAALADAPGCCDRAFARVFRWTGVGAAPSPALIGADAEGDVSDVDTDADPSDPEQKRLHSV